MQEVQAKAQRIRRYEKRKNQYTQNIFHELGYEEYIGQ
jgi:hypothetical protein